jgi:hypothetical protein
MESIHRSTKCTSFLQIAYTQILYLLTISPLYFIAFFQSARDCF